ncbi:hypothetical protein OS493_027499 [Desmophyllum pertusum]|uniref:Uncharacterized protein n=1 Tax=Desmophyllum pertusum TaxID=174260 RepID=A0A9W9Y9C8_9CNID|nr:hypothetical protein OS493_027499 [Desmophyllum pertusum]
MKFALVLGLCLAFAFVVESFEEDEEFLEDEYKNDKRFLCNTDGECGNGKCCLKNSFFHMCWAKRGEGWRCDPKSDCYRRCQDGLECRKNGRRSRYKCFRPIAPPPTEVPGSGDFNL